MKDFEEIVLETLSFYDTMTMEEIILEMDDFAINASPHLSIDDLENMLFDLVKQKKIKTLVVGQDRVWMRIFPKRKRWWHSSAPALH